MGVMTEIKLDPADMVNLQLKAKQLHGNKAEMY
jgi:hypothetical protein